MYLQITTKCNMQCPHCCFSCNNKGKHANYNVVLDAIRYASKHDDCAISIGGGEPTLHPRFFDILRNCLENFDYVWMATNGSQTKVMLRLAAIIEGEDYGECNCTEENWDYCTCHDTGIHQDNKLTVALSQDCFHSPINQRIVDLWTRYASRNNNSGYSILNSTKNNYGDGIVAQGRAKRTGSGRSTNHCV